VHLAGVAEPFIKKKNEKKQFFLNKKITSNIINYAKKIKCSKIIFFSSVYVYSGNPGCVFKENLKLRPIENLGKSKLACEELLKKINNKKIKIIIFRLFTGYGSYSRKKQYLNILEKSFKTKKFFIKYPSAKRDYIYVKDIVEILRKSIEKKNYNKYYYIFNLATGKSYTNLQVANKLKNILKIKKKIYFLKTKQKIINDHVANISKIKKFFYWKPNYSLEKGFRDLYE
jgi:nucleoside-diphosphate-sugar epimerase